MAHTFVYAAAALICEFLLGLGLALLLNKQIRGRGIVSRSLARADDVADGCRWRRLALMLNPNFGAINGTLKQFGINTESTDVDCVAALGDAFSDRGRRLAMDAVCLSRAAGRTASNSSGTLRSGPDRWIESLANVSTRNVAFAEAVDPDRSAFAHDGSAARVRSDFYSDRRWARFRD